MLRADSRKLVVLELARLDNPVATVGTYCRKRANTAGTAP